MTIDVIDIIDIWWGIAGKRILYILLLLVPSASMQAILQ